MANNGLENIGVSIIAEGLSSYQKAMSDYTKATDSASKSTEKFQETTAKTGDKGGGILGFIKNLVSGFKDSAQAAAKNVPGLEAVSTAIGGISTTAIVAVGAVALLAAGIFALGTRGAEFIGIQRAFNNTLGQFQEHLGSSSDYLDRLRVAAGDTVSELELMRLTNVALAGSGQEVGSVIGEALPNLLRIARVQAAATGQSVDFLFQSLVTGIKRGSPLLIDNTGLVLDITAANEAYAASIGKTVAELTEQEKQIALVQATVAAGEQAIAAAGGIQETAADKLARANALIQNSLNNLSIAVEPILGGILDVFNYFAGGVEQATAVIGPILREVVLRIGAVFSTVGQYLQPVIQFILDQLGNLGNFVVGGIQFFAKGAAFIAGAIGNGLLAGANRFIFPAVISIAQFIADFLTGFSPAKKGPLSTVDTGAGNIMKAWTEGFVGAFKPQAIGDVASEVNAQLGSIASLGINAVDKRLRQLDKALRPFQEQLKIVKDQFDSMKESADSGLRLIDRQLERLQPALLAGDKAAEEMTRQLNVQRLAIQQSVDAQQDAVDMAQIQLSYQLAMQQRERTLLEIQKARLGTQQKVTKEAKKAATASGSSTGAAPKPKTGGAGTPTQPLPTGGAPIAAAETTNPLAGLDAFGAELGGIFTGTLGAGGELEAFQANAATLQEQLARIGESDPVQGIVGVFDGFGDALQENFVLPIQEKIQEGVGWFTDPAIEGGLANFISRIQTEGVAAVLGDLAPNFTTFLTAAIITPIGGLPVLATVTSLFEPVSNWINGVVEGGGLPGIVNQIGSVFGNIPTLIYSALQGIGILMWNTLVSPFIEAVNYIIDRINEFFGVVNNSELVNFARTQLGIQIPEISFDHIDSAPPSILTSPPPPPNTGGRGGTSGRPSSTGVGGAAKGGLFTGGAITVGEQGRETMMAAQPFAVFSNQFTRAMNVLSNAILSSSMFSQPLAMPVGMGGGGTVNNNNLTINASMRGDVSPVQIANRIAVERALS